VKPLLHVAASPKGEAAISWRAAAMLLEKIDPAGERIVRRLDRDPPPFPDGEFAGAMMRAQTAEAAAAEPSLAASEVLIRELEATGRLVISTPMHNFTVPAALKAWLDQIVRFGRTFRSTPEGKIGLLADRETYVVIATGGPITPPAARQPDHLRPYLKDILACIGIRDVTFIAVEGASRGEAALKAGLAAAEAEIERIARREAR